MPKIGTLFGTPIGEFNVISRGKEPRCAEPFLTSDTHNLCAPSNSTPYANGGPAQRKIVTISQTDYLFCLYIGMGNNKSMVLKAVPYFCYFASYYILI